MSDWNKRQDKAVGLWEFERDRNWREPRYADLDVLRTRKVDPEVAVSITGGYSPPTVPPSKFDKNYGFNKDKADSSRTHPIDTSARGSREDADSRERFVDDMSYNRRKTELDRQGLEDERAYARFNKTLQKAREQAWRNLRGSR